MDFFLRCVVLSLAAWAVAFSLASLAAAVQVAWRRPAGTPDAEADWLLRMRLLPTGVGLAALVFAAIGLARFESRDGDEIIGWVLWLTSGAGVALAGTMAWQLAAQQWRTARLWRAWQVSAAPLTVPGLTIPVYRIDTGFPIVAVIGILRPRLVIDARVLDSCQPEELDAILAHERGHLRRRDNLRRLLFLAAPALWMPARAHDRWREATEEAADDLAAAQRADARLHLASALVKVARLAQEHEPAGWPSHLPASALYRGESLDRRVRRLLAPPAVAPGAGHHWGLAVAGVIMGAALAVQRDIHDAMEVVVALLP